MLQESADAVREVVGVLPRSRWTSGSRGARRSSAARRPGLGLATAEALAAEGANVTMFARRREVLEREADRIGALAVRGDVTNPRDLATVVQRTVEAFGGLDILVWNSGGPPPGPATSVTPESVEEAVELLLTPLVRLVDAVPARTSCRARAAASSSSRRAR